MTIKEKFALLAALNVVAFASMFWKAYVLCKIWAWHIVPILEPMPFEASIFLVLSAHLLTAKTSSEDTAGLYEKAGNAIFFAILFPAFILLFGYLATFVL